MELLRLLWLVSPALPVGGYAYSRALEYAVEAGWVSDVDSARSWILGVLERQVGTLDAPLLARLYDAWQADCTSDVLRWNELLCAARESRELALEDAQLGLSLARVLRDAGVERAQLLAGAPSYVALFALACVHWGVARRDALLGYAFALAETQVTVATKLVPLGQSAGQRVLASLLERLPSLVDEALARGDEALGSYAPSLAFASARHETQYSRMFRS